MSSRRSRRVWSVRRYLTAIVAGAAVVLVSATLFAANQVMDHARRNAHQQAGGVAEVVGGAIAGNVALATEQVVGLAGNPAVERLLVDPAACTLQIEVELFPGSRIDVVRPDGTVACSSLTGPDPGASHAGSAWFRRSIDGQGGVTGPMEDADGPGGAPAVFVGVAVHRSGATPIGVVALVLPTEQLGSRLEAGYGRLHGFELAVVDGATGSLLATTSDQLDDDGGSTAVGADPLEAAGYLSASRSIPGLPWRMVAGITPDAATADMRHGLLRAMWTAVAVWLVLGAALVVVHRRIARPLRRLCQVVAGGAPYGWDEVDRLGGPAEVVNLTTSFRSAISVAAAFEDRLTHQALHDPLTGLANRAMLQERLAHGLQRESRDGAGLAVLCVDLDRFKLVNDSLGHATGDEVLVATADRLRAVLRPADTLSRFAADEFVVVVEGVPDRGSAQDVARRVQEAVQTPIEVDGTSVRLSCSIGIAVAGRHSNPVELVADANNAMYLAKERGRSRVEVFDRSLRHQATTRLTLSSDLPQAIEQGRLHLEYQPQVDLITGATVGLEALVRWDHDVLGSVPPGTFIPIAEETGSIVPLGRFVLDQACRQAVRWRDEGYDVLMSVNVSSVQIGGSDLVADVDRALGDSGLSAGSLCLELTESVLMGDVARTAASLGDLHELGVQLSIDDFGTGYSSLAYLHRFRVDHVKIDRAFVAGLPDRHHQRSLVDAIVAIGQALDLQVVAEGVETGEQAEHLRRVGCQLGQGYLFARPQPPSALQPFLRRTGSRTVPDACTN